MKKTTITGFKGFDKNLVCDPGRIGQTPVTYRIGKKSFSPSTFVQLCRSGLHFCINPLDVLSYYPPRSGARYAIVKAAGNIDGLQKSHNDDADTKCCASELTPIKELSLHDLLLEGIEYLKRQKGLLTVSADINTTASIWAKGSLSATRAEGSTAANTGYKGVALTEDYNSIAATSNVSGLAFCNAPGSIAAGSNCQAYAQTAAHNSIAATISGGAKVTAEKSVAVSIRGSASASKNSIALSYHKAKGDIGAWLVLARYKPDCFGELEMKVKTVRVDGKKIKADTYYKLSLDGKEIEPY